MTLTLKVELCPSDALLRRIDCYLNLIRLQSMTPEEAAALQTATGQLTDKTASVQSALDNSPTQ